MRFVVEKHTWGFVAKVTENEDTDEVFYSGKSTNNINEAINKCVDSMCLDFENDPGVKIDKAWAHSMFEDAKLVYRNKPDWANGVLLDINKFDDNLEIKFRYPGDERGRTTYTVTGNQLGQALHEFFTKSR